jgi:hypothetical protein
MQDFLVSKEGGVKPRFEKPVAIDGVGEREVDVGVQSRNTTKKRAESGDGTVELVGGFKDRNYA